MERVVLEAYQRILISFSSDRDKQQAQIAALRSELATDEQNRKIQLEHPGLLEEFGIFGCDTVDHLCDALLGARAKIAVLESAGDAMARYLVESESNEEGGLSLTGWRIAKGTEPFTSGLTLADVATIKRLTDYGALINDLCEEVHEANAKWWLDPATGQPKQRNVGELLMLVTSELAEAMEGHRKGLMDDKLPHRPMFEVELADAVIRIFDIAAGLGLDLGGAYVEKMEFNRTREDHTLEARMKQGGKKY